MIRSYCRKVLIRPTIAALVMVEWIRRGPKAWPDKGKTCKHK